MKRSGQNAEFTRNSLINSFFELYKTTDVSQITISRICDMANCDRTTFYRYFLDISDILNQLEDTIIDNLKNDIQNKSINLPYLPFEKFNDFNDKYGEYIVIFYERGNRNFYHKFKDLIKNYVFDYFGLKINDEEKKEFLYEFLFSSLIVSYSYWYHNQNIMSLDLFVKLVNNMIIHGGKVIIDYIK